MKEFKQIAIDGYAACGKSTLAKQLAKELDYLYLDSGAIYRAITHYFLSKEILPDAPSLADHFHDIQVIFSEENGIKCTFLNGINVEKEIRSLEVSNMVSQYAAISSIRRFAVDLQRKMAIAHHVVMDGRDIGSVVFPEAALKLFLTASLPVRTERRQKEYLAKGKTFTWEEIQQNLQQRDHIDSTRADSPLIQPSDAVLIDNTNLSREEQLNMVLALCKTRL